MHRHDLDLIAALAEGTLEDDTVARARVESCEVCRAEYAAQTDAIAALAVIPPVGLTEQEKATLHRDLWTALTTPAGEEKRRSPWYSGWVYAAAGVFVLVGLVGALTLGGGQQAAETFREVASGLGDENPALSADEGAAATTAPAAPQPTAPAAAEAASAPPNADDFTEIAGTLRDQGADVRSEEFTSQDTQAARAAELEACLTQAGLTDHVVAGQMERDRIYLFAITEDADRDTRFPVWFVAFDTCSVVYVDE